MTDLSALKGMTNSLAGVPSVLYFHENQFAYPDDSPAEHLVERQLTSIYSAISADYLVFNSQFNQQSFLDGCEVLLLKLPDGVPRGIIDQLKSKSVVIPVALKDLAISVGAISIGARSVGEKSARFNIVWNHRWEQDKGLVELESLLILLLEESIEFEFNLIGQSFRKIPAEITRIGNLLRGVDKLAQVGFIEDRQEYYSLLESCHVVLSTARHEFQGLAVLEAVQRGCIPVVPDDLAYKEFVQPDFRYGAAEEAVKMLVTYHQQYCDGGLPNCNLPDQVSWQYVQHSWRNLLNRFQ